jgi:hypothetical protein
MVLLHHDRPVQAVDANPAGRGTVPSWIPVFEIAAEVLQQNRRASTHRAEAPVSVADSIRPMRRQCLGLEELNKLFHYRTNR